MRLHSAAVSERAIIRPIAWSVVIALAAVAIAAVSTFSSRVDAAGPAILAAVSLVAVCIPLLVARTVVRREAASASAAIDTAIASASDTLSRVERLATTGRLAAGVAHEVGNPLAAIANYAHVVRQRTGDDARIREPLDALEREVERIDRIVRGLLDYARPRRATPKAVRVDAVLNDVVRLVADQGLLRRVQVQWDIEQREAAVYAERHDLEQAFVNLLLNAVEAMAGVGQLVLRSRLIEATDLRAAATRRRDDADDERFVHEPNPRLAEWLERERRPDRVLQVVVADSGPGVLASEADRIFEPFYSTKVAGRGTGLGLAIVAQSVAGIGGTIWVQPAREGGAAFVILLPIAGPTGMAAATE